MADPSLLTVGEVVRLLRISRSHLYEHVLGRELPVIHFGRAVRVPRTSVEAYVARLLEHSASDVR